MGKEVDLLINYPKTLRNLEERAASKNEDDRAIARKFDYDFFDGERRYGYGGLKYNARFWRPVIPTFKSYWGLNATTSVLDVGCAKGFMIHDIADMVSGVTVKGVDISEYAVNNAIEDMRPHVQIADARKLPFGDKSFDVVISINTIHNLEIDECAKALREIERVSRGKSFVTVDAYRNEEEKHRMFSWNLTAKTILSVDDWVNFFRNVGYTGDYFWFIP